MAPQLRLPAARRGRLRCPPQARCSKADHWLKPVIREYSENDYQACEDLVGRTWQFSEHFRPAGFCDAAKYAYTRSSVASSNFRRVVERDGQVVGFLFGCNNQRPADLGLLRQLLLSSGMLRRLLFVRGVRRGEKLALLRAISQHEVHRGRVEKRGASEINLFALDQDFQRKGLGRQLVTEFLDDCRRHGVRRVIVEVNVSQASDFYEKCGFAKIRDFVSPLHEMTAGKGSLAALYERHLA